MTGRISAILLAGMVAATSGCSDLLFDGDDHVYDGPPVVEFGPVLPGGSYVYTASFPAGSDDAHPVSVRVNYIAPPPDVAVNGSFRVADGGAVEGQHFSLPGGASFTIPSGENFTDVPVELLGGGLADGESITLVLELLEGDGYEVSQNYKEFEIRASKEG